MKKLLLVFPFITIASMAQAEEMSYGIGPDRVCVAFESALIPADYKRVPSCDEVKDEETFTSLEDRLRARLAHRIKANTTETSNTKVSAKYRRHGRAALTKSTPAISDETYRNQSTSQVRSRTFRDYRSAYRGYALRQGAAEDKEAIDENRASYQNPGGFRSIRNKNTDQQLSNTPKWTATARDRFRQKNYGTNPYNLSSLRSAEQRAFRAKQKANERVDVKGRALSHSRRWRPDRILGDLSGNTDWIKEQAKIRAKLRTDLAEE